MVTDRVFTELDRTMRTISSGLSPQALSRIAGQLARELRRSQQQRMRAQKAPDGTQWEPRRRRISRLQQRIRFIWNNETRTLKNWHHGSGKYGQTITGWDEDRSGIRTFYRSDILRFLEIRTRRINRDTTKTVPMFAKLRTARYLKVKADASGVTVGYSGVAARIARVHQFGERDRVAAGMYTDYPARELLGITPADERLIQRIIMDNIARAVA
ncbi:TPA: phage virion morphogenesis protein [Escherichia coli]|uniref:Phage virion morphogenesis protein n=1 Tax=Escherichia coli TaxID=562 RepID=A0A1V3VTE3_ECOLX|nr:phage virion morphogenesis protein [Escherichia coli]OSL65235.1 phage virion morphogenesis protein [Escherichia coli TA008]MCX1021158.1 phage virion morphogenesis protein [Escherichia coli]OOK22378.1 phage virion morphogenesis protein [Escherichia coli]RDA44252.1 phage virion morphogenesis protein [Escherichia coli]HCO6056490.1 phage virion morphogenesis protein [Escherichia coli]